MSDLIKRAEWFARERHAGQFRKGAAQEPYAVHLEEVAALTVKWGGSEEAIAAAWLHDTVEDCPPTSLSDLEVMFGNKVASVVGELTDDKSLAKADRKQLQLIYAPKKSPEAAIVKLADKSSNVGAIANSPPADWSLARRLEYIDWAAQVVGRLPTVLKEGLEEFLKRCDLAELQAYEDLGTLRQSQNAALRVMERRAKRVGASEEQTKKFLLRFMKGVFQK